MRAKLFTTFFVICFLFSAQSKGADRDKEVDVAYAKLLAYLPENAQLIHVPYADKLNTYGPNISVKRLENEDVTGGKVLRVKVNQVGKNEWDDAVTADIGGELKKGDVVYMMFWAKIAADNNTNNDVTINGASIQKASAPYTKIISRNVTLTPNWQTLALAGKAEDDYENYGSQINFPLSSGKHTIDFGPVFIFNLGPNVDTKTLPFL